MKKLLVLGGGTAGTIIANKLRKRLSRNEWSITVVDRDSSHVYQPGFLFMPFAPPPGDLHRSRQKTLVEHVELVLAEIDLIRPEDRQVDLAGGGSLDYDYLVIATGTSPRPDETPGMLGAEWRRSIFDFFTFEGAEALRQALATFDHGRLVVHIAEMPIKCPVAPLEFAFLAEASLRDRGIRDRVEIVYVTPQPGAFTRPVASKQLGQMLDERKIALETDFAIERIDPETKTLVSYDEREVPFDLLVTVPVNKGADFVGRSGLGDELNYVSVDRFTFRSKQYDDVFAVGDSSDIPTSKAGSVAHYSAEVFVENFLQLAAGEEPSHQFDGHANCFIETGDSKALLIDFNYDTEPLPGKYPLPVVGPLGLLRETRANHAGKLAFRWMYWNVLLPGRPLPLPNHMSMVGKTTVTEED